MPAKVLALGLYVLSLSQPGHRPRAVSLISHNSKVTQCAIPRKAECWEETEEVLGRIIFQGSSLISLRLLTT